jgi:hypothetical protein
MGTVSEQTKAQFRTFCRQATEIQLRNILAKETLARRKSYAQIAREIMRERGLT